MGRVEMSGCTVCIDWLPVFSVGVLGEVSFILEFTVPVLLSYSLFSVNIVSFSRK